MAPPQISSRSRNNPQHIGSNATLRHKSTDKNIQLPIAKPGPDSSGQCAMGLLLGGLDPPYIHYEPGIDRSSKSYMSDLRLGGLKKHEHGESGSFVHAGQSYLRTCVLCAGLLSWAPLSELSCSPGINCLTEESGLAGGKL